MLMGVAVLPNSTNPVDLISGMFITVMGLWMFYLGVTAVLAPASDLGHLAPWRPALALVAVGGAAVMASGLRGVIRWLRADRLPRQPRHQDLMRAAAGLPPESRQPPPLRGSAPPRPAAPIAVANAPGLTEPIAAANAPAPAEPASPPATSARTLPSGEPILAHWTYPAEEWKAYAEGEWRYRLWEAAGLALLIGLVGGLLATWRTGESSYASALVFGAFLGALRLAVAGSQRHANAAGPGYAIISPTAVLLNGTHHALVSERRHFGGVRYASLDRPPVLEFTVKWKTRNGWMNEQIRVPIPTGREDEANAVVAAFERGWAAELPPEQGQAMEIQE
jgi:hypothetical protein